MTVPIHPKYITLASRVPCCVYPKLLIILSKSDSLMFLLSNFNVFRHAGELYGQPGQSTDTYAVGLCTGLLAAAAVASSPALPALIPLGVEVTLIAFRVGSYVGTTAKHLDMARSGSASWSTIVTGTTESVVHDALSALHADKVNL